jgi:hypothetical protein
LTADRTSSGTRTSASAFAQGQRSASLVSFGTIVSAVASVQSRKSANQTSFSTLKLVTAFATQHVPTKIAQPVSSSTTKSAIASKAFDHHVHQDLSTTTKLASACASINQTASTDKPGMKTFASVFARDSVALLAFGTKRFVIASIKFQLI